MDDEELLALARCVSTLIDVLPGHQLEASCDVGTLYVDQITLNAFIERKEALEG